ncbi:MAG TPA: EAL domain-containing protein [Xanthobacteraceae bacterium]|nr:EAL domain-containing protein [Xanthobacteraceae bacterium]
MLLRSIRSRLLLLVFATVVPFLALIAAGLWSQWRDDQAKGTQRALNEARLIAAQLDDHIGNLENLMVGLSRAVSANPADTAKNDALLRQVRSKEPDYLASILVYSLDGTNIGTSGDPTSRPNVARQSFFKEAVANRGLSIGQVFHTAHSQRWLLTVAYPVEDEAGNLRAIISTGTQLAHFHEAFQTEGLPAGGVLRISNQDGIVVLQSNDPHYEIGSDISHLRQITRHLNEREWTDIGTWSDGIERITGTSTAHKVPWLVSVGLPTHVAFAAVASRLRWGAYLGTAALIAAFAIAWMISGRIARPLRQLEADASALAAGALNHRSAVATRDEVGKLADAFNRMACALERRQYEVQESNDTLSAVIDASPVAIVCSGLDRRIMLWSRAAERLYGYTAEETIGEPIRVVPSEGEAVSSEVYQRALNGESIHDVEARRHRKDGTLVEVRIAAAPMYNPDGTVRGVAWAHEDITRAKQAEEQLRRLAHYDPLTGLPNRLSLHKELERLLASLDATRPTSVALFDLDGFKDVNDTLGHSIGDRLLIEVGQRMSRSIHSHGQCGQVYRLGGDEFVVVLPHCGDPRTSSKVVEAMLRELAEPFRINDQTLHLGGSAGIAVAPNDAGSVDDLIASADLALYQAKSEGGRTYRLFMPVLRAQAQARRGLDLELRRAFSENEFELYFQPEIRLRDRAVIGAEALLRWRHPQRGVLAPWCFIETLADSAIAPEVGRWIIQEACEKAAALRAMGLPLARIGVNLFPAQLHGETLLQSIEDTLSRTGLPAEVLELEITENVALNYEDAHDLMVRLCARGVQLAFDDFGTGYASLSYLTRFPLSRIKIDRSFVRNIPEDAENAGIVRSLIAMAHNLGLTVIAEGVETEAQAAFLLEQECEEAQGFLFARPLTASELEDYLKTQRQVGTDAVRGMDDDARTLDGVIEPQRKRAQSSRRGRAPKV